MGSCEWWRYFPSYSGNSDNSHIFIPSLARTCKVFPNRHSTYCIHNTLFFSKNKLIIFDRFIYFRCLEVFCKYFFCSSTVLFGIFQEEWIHLWMHNFLQLMYRSYFYFWFYERFYKRFYKRLSFEEKTLPWVHAVPMIPRAVIVILDQRFLGHARQRWCICEPQHRKSLPKKFRCDSVLPQWCSEHESVLNTLAIYSFSRFYQVTKIY